MNAILPSLAVPSSKKEITESELVYFSPTLYEWTKTDIKVESSVVIFGYSTRNVSSAFCGYVNKDLQTTMRHGENIISIKIEANYLYFSANANNGRDIAFYIYS